MKIHTLLLTLIFTAFVGETAAQSWSSEGALASVKANQISRLFDDGKLEINQNEVASIYIWDHFGPGPFTTPGEPVIFEIDGQKYNSIALSSSGPQVVYVPVTMEIIAALKRGNKLKLGTLFADEWLIFSLSGSSAALSSIGY